MKYLENLKEKKFFKQHVSSRHGQVALILILVIAVAFVFFGMTLNLGRTSQTKTGLTIGANVGAAMMSSLFAGYAESLYQTWLGGEEEAGSDLMITRKSNQALAWQNFFIDYMTLGLANDGWGPAGVGLDWMNIAAGATLDYLWVSAMNKVFDQLPPVEEFMERGISMALQSAVTDAVAVPDKYDINMDGKFGPGTTTNRFGFLYTKERLQKVIKFWAHPYHIQQFKEKLGQFVYKDYWRQTGEYTNEGPDILDTSDNHWGLWDPASCEETKNTHYCCRFKTPSENPLPSQPADCERLPTDTTDGAIAPASHACNSDSPPAYCNSRCAQGCVYSSAGGEHDCPFQQPDGRHCVYDPLFENNTNTYLSFKENWGHDDENKQVKGDYRVFDPLLEDYPQPDPRATWPGGSVGSWASGLPTGGYFRATDAKGLLFPTLWDLWRIDLADMTEANKDQDPNFCFWCTDNVPNCETFGGLSAPATGCFYGGTVSDGRRVDKINKPEGVFVGNECFSDAEICINPDASLNTEEAIKTFWVKGSDRFLSHTYPYNQNVVGKNCSSSCTAAECWAVYNVDPDQIRCNTGDPNCCKADCPNETLAACDYRCSGSESQYPFDPACLYPSCSETCSGGCIDEMAVNCRNTYTCGATTGNTAGTPNDRLHTSSQNWYSDTLDNVNVVLDAFISWARGILAKHKFYLAKTIESWYPVADFWLHWDTTYTTQDEMSGELVERLHDGQDPCAKCRTVEGRTYPVPKGQLTRIYCMMVKLNERLKAWRDNSNFVAGKCDDVMCYPEKDPNNPSRILPPGFTSTCSEAPTNPLIPPLTLISCPIQPPGVPHVPNNDTLSWNLPSSTGVSGATAQWGWDVAKLSEVVQCINWYLSPDSTISPDPLINHYKDPYDTYPLGESLDFSSTAPPLSFYLSTPLPSLSSDDEAKLTKRSMFLNNDGPLVNFIHKGVIQKVNALIAFLDESTTRFRDFLGSKELKNVYDDWIKSRSWNMQTLSNNVIYGWRDKAPEGKPETEGMWHIVKVQARVPTLCGDKCWRHFTSISEHKTDSRHQHDPGLPQLREYVDDADSNNKLVVGWIQEAWGEVSTNLVTVLGDSLGLFPDCYDKDDLKASGAATKCFRGGTTKMRVIRWDQTRSSMVKFANNMPIWKFVSGGQASGGNLQAEIDGLNDQCNINTAGSQVCRAYHAFLLNKPSEHPGLWNAADALLKRGIMTQSCAEYFFRNQSDLGGERGFNVKFVPCAGDFPGGLEEPRGPGEIGNGLGVDE